MFLINPRLFFQMYFCISVLGGMQVFTVHCPGAWPLDVFIPSSRQFKSGVRCIRAGLLLCQEDYPLMTGQHFHPSEFDLSEAEVALNLHKVTLGTNKTRVWGVIPVPLIACCSQLLFLHVDIANTATLQRGL